MKKFNLIIAAMLLISVSAFAVDVAPVASVSGSASVEFGFDIDSGDLSIVNAADADLTVTLLDTSVSKGEGEVVGVITLSGIKVAFDDDDGTTIATPGVAAKIHLAGPALYLDITNLGAKTDFATAVDLGILTETAGTTSTDAAPAGSVSVVYTADAFNVTVTVGTDDNADGDAADFDAALKLGVTAVENLTFNAGFAMDNNGAAFGYGAAVSYVAGPATVAVAYDGGAANEVVAGLDLDFGATLGVDLGTDFTAYDLMAVFSTGTLVEVATLGVTFEAANFADYAVKVRVDATVGVLTPYAQYTWSTPGVTSEALIIGTGIAVIENVALDVKYVNDDLAEAGKVTAKATIAY